MAVMEVDELFDAWERAWSGRDPRGFESVCARGVHYEDPLTPEPLVGTRALAATRKQLWAGDAGRAGQLDRRAADRRDVRLRAVPAARAPTPGRSGGSHPTGRAVDVHAVVYAELEDGLLHAGAGVLRRLRRGDDARRAAEARHRGRAGDADAARVRDQRVTRTGGWSESRPALEHLDRCAGAAGCRGGRRGCRRAVSRPGQLGLAAQVDVAAEEERLGEARRAPRSVSRRAQLVAVRRRVHVDDPDPSPSRTPWA